MDKLVLNKLVVKKIEKYLRNTGDTYYLNGFFDDMRYVTFDLNHNLI